jgi:enoyl-CoA hydratase
MLETLKLDIEDALATVTLDRPELNLINQQMIKELRDACRLIEDDSNVRVIVITGGVDRCFTAGVDLTYMKGLDTGTAREFIRSLHIAISGFHKCDKVTIAAINRYCYGGGFELAMACDISIASSNALMGLPEIKVGIPSVIEAALLPLLVGTGRAKEMILLGEPIKAVEAERVGLVNKVVSPEKLHAEVQKTVNLLLSYSPVALRQQKRILNYWLPENYETAIAFSIEGFSQCFASDETREAMNAFLKKRRPEFKNH